MVLVPSILHLKIPDRLPQLLVCWAVLNLHGWSWQECCFPVKCSTETFLSRELQHVMLCLVIIPDDRHFPASLSWVLVQVDSSRMLCLDFRLLF